MSALTAEPQSYDSEPSPREFQEVNIDEIYKQFCKDTKRNGGVLISSSIKEWTNYLLKCISNH